MGDWTYVKGKHNSKRASIKKILKTVLEHDEYCVTCNGQEFDLSFDGVGIDAASKIQKIIDHFKSFDPNASIEMFTEILFYR